MDPIAAYVDRLARIPAPVHAVNPYAGRDRAAEIRRANLRRFLSELQVRGVRTAMVSEAPGYRGCRQSGISFTSEHVLLTGVPKLRLFGPGSGYEIAGDLVRPWKEPSSTIVWRTLAEAGSVPLIWAAYPFHPHEPGTTLSNRAPRRDEIELGRPLLTEILELFGIERIAAVGNVAAGTLETMGLPVVKVRHPSHGGAAAFREGMLGFLEREETPPRT